MLSVGVGIRRVDSTLPEVVYALLSGLNSAIIGIIAFSGIRLAKRSICDKFTLFTVCAVGCIAILYRGNIPFSLVNLQHCGIIRCYWLLPACR